MTLQPVNDTAEAVINYSIAGQPAINRINFELAGGYSQADIDTLAAAVDIAVDTWILPLIQPAVNYLFTRARGLESAIDLEAINADSAGTGAASGTPMTAQQSYAIQLLTGATGRSARGRFYMPPTTNVNTASVRAVTPTYSDACVDAVANLITDVLAVSGWLAVVTSRYTAGALRPSGVNRVISTVGVNDLNIDTQRRRVGK